MPIPLRVLILEDSSTDAELELHELKRAGFALDWTRVQTEAEFMEKLDPGLDLIVADYRLPQFDGERALARLHESGFDIPFILVSGTVGEEKAVALMKQGAADYLLKDRLTRLGQAARRALEQRRIRLEKAQADLAVRASEQRLRVLVDNCADIIAVCGADGRLRYASPAVERILGYTLEELRQRPLESLLHPDDLPAAQAAVDRIRAGEAQVRCELRCRRGDGRYRWLEVIASKPRDDASIDGVVLNARDVTDSRAQRERISRLSRVRAVLSAINSTIIRVRSRDELFGETARIPVVHGRFPLAWVCALDGERPRPAAWAGDWAEPPEECLAAVCEGLEWTLIEQARASRRPAVCKDAREQTLLARPLRPDCCGSVIALPLIVGDAVTAVLVLYADEAEFFDEDELEVLQELACDVSFSLDHIAKEEQLHYLAFYDPLTGLPNRTLFIDRLDQVLRVAADKVALLLLSLEQLTVINDTYGLRFGDALLQQVTARLRAAWGESDSLGHLGTGVFGLVLPEVGTEAELVHRLDADLFSALQAPFRIEDEEFALGAKLGVALFPADGADAERLLRSAETALAKAKYSSDRYAFYSADLNQRVSRKLMLETRLRQAVERRQFVVDYQPKVDSQTRHLNGLEALIRWNDPENGLIQPEQFIPLLEENGLIIEVGRWVLNQAASDFRRWRERGLEPPRIAVNVSAAQLRRPDFVEQVVEVLAPFGEEEACLDLEITESMLMADIEESIRKLAQARSQGLTVAIDDFGTGYSSLAYIARLPINALKIDKSFIQHMTHNPDDLAIVNTIISLAHALKLKVIAEGVESEEQATFLKLLRCDEMQGYLFSRPLGAEQVEAYMRGAH